jgi:chromosome segregation ATPase
MESHDVREENAVLRLRVEHVESKLRAVVRALEQRNEQIHQWSRMYDALQTEFAEAQESANTQSAFIAERNETIGRLTDMIDHLRQTSRQQSATNAQMASELRDEILQQKQQLVDTLNRISRAKIPAEQAFEEMNDILDRKEAKIRDLQAQYEDLNARYAKLDQDVEMRAREVRGLHQQNEDANNQIRRLTVKLQDARSGRKELGRIEQLELEIERYRRLYQQGEREKRKLKKTGSRLRDEIQQQHIAIGQYESNVKAVMDQNVELRNRLAEQQRKNDAISEKFSKSMENERRLSNMFHAKKSKAHNQKLEIRELRDQLKQASKKKTQIAVRRLQGIKDQDEEKAKNQEAKLQLRQEIEKRLDAEQQMFNMKDEMEALRNEIALVKEKYSELKGEELKPLLDAIRDLQVEAITVDSEYYELMEAVPEDHLEIQYSDDLSAHDIVRIVAVAQQIQIENKALRILLGRFARAASMYHRIAAVIARYPILSTEDIGTEADRGSWVLPADVEHLQRTIVKLHELLVRKKVAPDE